MLRIQDPLARKGTLFIAPVVFLLLLCVMACSDTSSNLNRYFRGQTLDINVVTIDRVPRLLYSTIDENQVIRHYELTPNEQGTELVLVRLKVENHTATSTRFTADTQAAELRDFLSNQYFPVDVDSKVKEVSTPPGREGRSMIFITGPLELALDTGVDGWMVFEAPKGTKFREFRWRAGDTITIDF